MESPFPPMPPDYPRVIVARLILLAWGLIEFGIMVSRLRRWKSVRPEEIHGWIAAIGISGFIAFYGYCTYPVYDSNDWLQILGGAVLTVSVAGIAICLSKVLVEGTWFERLQWFGLCLAAACVIGILVHAWYAGCSSEAPRRSQCRNNLKAIGLGLHNHHDSLGAFPPGVNNDPPVSWRIAILPFCEQSQIHRQYDRRVAWDHVPNLTLARTRLPLYVCPSCYIPQYAEGEWFTAYSMLTGTGTVGDTPRGTTFKDVADGTSNTLMVVEACGAQIVWTEPRDVNCAVQPTGINRNGTRPGESSGWMSSYHSLGAMGLMVDGSVRFLSSDTDSELLRRMATINGGERIEE
ncbi:MAG: DUF1559 domain-containing protein [Planctomycetes bacterium]|nr:DUF1559 domain-containing protein [Planctomycetota bacterium]